jgi:glycosyltransferase domain-containing protein
LTYLKNSQLDSIEFDLLSDITIIIFTKNRKLFLERQIKWWQKFPVKLLILDGSDNDEYLKEALEQNSSINYIKELRLSSRMKIAAENVTTKYAAISGDDDFYLVSALLECIKFLEQNDDFVSCLPQFLSFDVSKNEVLFKNSYLESINFAISSENIIGRVCQKMSLLLTQYKEAVRS